MKKILGVLRYKGTGLLLGAMFVFCLAASMPSRALAADTQLSLIHI